MMLPEHNLWRYTSVRSRARVYIAIIALTFGITAAAAIIFQCWHRDTSWEDVRRRGVIRIGYAIEAPYAFITTNGLVSGHDPELARVIVQQLRVPRVEWQLVEFSSLIAGLNANQYDVIAAGMFITPEREQQVAFSAPTFRVDSALLVQRGNPHQLHSYADIARDPTARIAVLSGSFEEKQLGRAGVPAERLISVPDARSGRILVDSAQVDGLALSAPTIHWMVEQKKVRESEMASPFESFPAPAESPTKLGAFAFRLEDVALRRAWNAELKQFLGTKAHLRLMNQFGFTAADMPPSATNTNSSQKP